MRAFDPRPSTAPWLLAAAALVGCLDGADESPQPVDAADVGMPDRDVPDAGMPGDGPIPDAGPGCAPLAAPALLRPPAVVDGDPCPEGYAVRVLASAGSRVDVRALPLDPAEDGAVELWWPLAEGWLRVDRQRLDAAALAWSAPPEGAAIVLRSRGRWRISVVETARPTRPITVTGLIDGWQRIVDPDGLASPTPLSTAGARVDVVDAEGLLAAAGYVGPDGRLALRGDTAEGPATVRLVSEARALGVPVRVGPDGDLPWAEAVAEVDGSAGIEAALDPEGATAGAWFVARTAAAGLAALEPWLPSAALASAPPVRYRWRPGFSDPCGSCYRPGPAPLIELGGRIGDPDEWDRAIIAHELGHYVAGVFSRDDSGGGPHDGSPIEPAIAWSEGLATFLASWPDTPLQLDYKLTGVARLDLEAMPQPEAFGTADGRADGPISERLVAAVLWDLHDGPADDDDPAALDGGALFAPLFETLAGPWVDRGAPGIDLVDYLDALACDEPPPSVQAVLESREVPHAPTCRLKGQGPLEVEWSPDGRVTVRALTAGRLRFTDGTALTVRAGDPLTWRPPSQGASGVALTHPGGRAVVTLTAPTARLRPMVRQAGAWMLQR